MKKFLNLKSYSDGSVRAPGKVDIRKKVAGRLRDKLYVEPTKKIELSKVVRLLKTVRGLKGRAWLVGGTLTEGYTRRDFDIVITEPKDAHIIIKALGSLGPKAHFILQKAKPPAPILVELTGRGPEERAAY